MATLTPEIIKIGMRDLSHLNNPAYPPSALEFVKHCRDRAFFDVQAEVMDYITKEKGKEWEWSGLVPFNVYTDLRYNPLGNETHDQLRQRIEKVYKALSWHDLKPLPENHTALPEKPNHHPINDERGYRQFSARVERIMMANVKDLNERVKSSDMLVEWKRKWWPEYKQTDMTVFDWLKEVAGVSWEINPPQDCPVQAIIQGVTNK